MKVTIITKEYPPNVYGGAGVHVYNLSRSLARMMNVEVRSFGKQKVTNRNPCVKGYTTWDKVARKQANLKFKPVLETISTDLLIASDPVNSDIIHTHTWYAALAGCLCKRLYHKPLVVTCHSLEPLRPWKEEQLGSGYSLSTWLERIAIQDADRIIAVSKMMKEDIKHYFDVDENKIEIIHNGINIKKWKYTSSRKTQRKFGIGDNYILFVGRTTKQKGMIHLIGAANYLDQNLKIVICTSGADTEEYAREISQAARSKKNVLIIDKMLKEEDYIELYSGCRVFVCPSVYEPFGIINLEAMACARPVVGSAIGGIKEVVIPGKTGILVDPANPVKLAEAINYLISNPEIAGVYGKNGRKRVEEHFSWVAIAQKTKQLYVNLLEEWWRRNQPRNIRHP